MQRLRDAGVLVTLNSDNAEMFGIDVADEMCAVRDAFGWQFGDVADICLNGVESAFVDDAERRSMRSSFAAAIDALRPRPDLAGAST